jgi:anti-anti-sigma regulatory factor
MSDPFFSLAVRRSDTGTVVSVAGDLDVATAPPLADALAAADGDVTVDLCSTMFADPSTLGVLLGGRAECRTMRAERRTGGAVARLLALTGTDLCFVAGCSRIALRAAQKQWRLSRPTHGNCSLHWSLVPSPLGLPGGR